MTPEEIERTMEFILRSQADSVVRMDRLEQNMGHLEHKMTSLQETVGRLGESQESLAARVETLVSLNGDLIHVSRQTLGRVSRLEESFYLLVQIAGAHAERLDRLEGGAGS